MNRKQAEGEHPSAILHKWRLLFSRKKKTLNRKTVGGQNKNNNCMNLIFSHFNWMQRKRLLDVTNSTAERK